TNVDIDDERKTPRQWIMYSLGPDMSPFAVSPPKGTGTTISPSRYFIGNRYDPTNGTISTGNVVRFADGLNFP
ncbi:MAG: hypothetical protein ABI579_05315, partial [Candidatus Sumerlaeota bacterium]